MPGIGSVNRKLAFEILRILKKQRRICMVKLYNNDRVLSVNSGILKRKSSPRRRLYDRPSFAISIRLFVFVLVRNCISFVLNHHFMHRHVLHCLSYTYAECTVNSSHIIEQPDAIR